MNYLADLDVLVLGLGDSGLAMAQWCARFGARVKVWDSREEPPQAVALAETVPAAVRLSGALGLDVLDGVRLVLKSPGLAPSDGRIAPVLKEAADIGIAIQGELDLFARALAELKAERQYAPKVIAITGTNGKTTTTAMTGLLVERAGRRVAMAGNIGPSMLGLLGAALDREPVSEPKPSVHPEPVEGSAPTVASEAVLRQAQDERDLSASESTSLQTESTSVQPAPTAVHPEPVEGSAQTVASEAVLRQAQDERDLSASEPTSVQTEFTSVQSEPNPVHPGPTPVHPEPVEGSARTVASEAVLRQAQDERMVVAQDERMVVAQDQRMFVAQDERPLLTQAELDLADEEAPLVELIAPPPRAPVFESLPEVWVLELSSFQLDRVRGFEPSASTILNITQDHLDWHGSMPAYVAAKGRVYAEPSVMVINRDDAQVEALVEQLTAPPTVAKGSKVRAVKPVPRKLVRFGLDAPKRPGDFGLVVENGMAWLVRAHEADETLVKKRGKPEIEHEIHLQRLMPADALRIRGRHNAANALAALALATAIGCPLAPMLHALREYRGEPHRVEFIATIDRVDAYDDSKGTNVGATVAAIDGLGADREPAKLVLLMGGDGKGQDFSPLAEPVRRHARAVATIGRDAQRMEAALERSGVTLQRHATLEAATRWAFAQAAPGDAVLLSPACASLDMFRNYKHRAEVFVAEVRALALEAGEMA